MNRFTRVVGRAAAAVMLVATVYMAVHAQVGKSQGLIEPNLASEKDLLSLPGMNATLAKGVLGERPFASMASLNAYLSKSLNKDQLATLYTKIFIPLNLNTAPDEEILMIPNLGPRMLREFKEYRPYRTLAVFRREIGKYVDDREVARLEQHVFVPINLNTASDEDILTIPGLGPRMLREFKEYRPYKTMDQFRREIGKYVDTKEVARLERYVTLN
jgi:DNA uptake protein ComE-like DNA-binding protein